MSEVVTARVGERSYLKTRLDALSRNYLDAKNSLGDKGDESYASNLQKLRKAEGKYWQALKDPEIDPKIDERLRLVHVLILTLPKYTPKNAKELLKKFDALIPLEPVLIMPNETVVDWGSFVVGAEPEVKIQQQEHPDGSYFAEIEIDALNDDDEKRTIAVPDGLEQLIVGYEAIEQLIEQIANDINHNRPLPRLLNAWRLQAHLEILKKLGVKLNTDRFDTALEMLCKTITLVPIMGGTATSAASSTR